ncbi:Alpha/Beta hydrolase protein [Gorgonomyces haynaldii]|nr:Alpha/Beta hydrolase protein [Gorgonomyces haynaldii]
MLKFDLYAGSKTPLVIMPGLFGSKQNWRSLGKQFSRTLDRPVYCLDLRNHGDSFHGRHTYDDMMKDIQAFTSAQQLNHVDFIGHSMGGKLLMHMLLKQQPFIRKSMVVDMAPVQIVGPSVFGDYIKIMKRIESLNLTSQKDADLELQSGVPDLSTRLFLLTNLKKQPDGTYKFRNNLKAIEEGLPDVFGFPFTNETSDKSVWFIKGSKSPYIQEKHYPIIQRYFPNAQVKIVQDAGHWVHAEQPKAFSELVYEYLQK